MFDSALRRIIDPPLNVVASILPRWISPNMVTFVGFGFGLLSFFSLIGNAPLFALFCLGVNRFADGLDGAVARRSVKKGRAGVVIDATSELGGYLDIVSDFLIWSLLPLGFIALDGRNAVAAAVLLSSFAISMTVFLAFATMAEKRRIKTEAQGRKSFYYLAGLAEGGETILFFAIVMLYPSVFVKAAFIFAFFVYLSSLGRIITSWQVLR